MRDEKLHGFVARSTFPFQNVQSTPCSGPLFGSCDVEKVRAVVAQSTCPSQNVQKCKKLTSSDHFWKLTCRKSARCGRRKGHLDLVKNVKTTTCSDRFCRFRCGFAWQTQVRKNARCFVGFPKTMAGVGAFEEDLAKMHLSRGRCNTREMFICLSELVWRSGR